MHHLGDRQCHHCPVQPQWSEQHGQRHALLTESTDGQSEEMSLGTESMQGVQSGAAGGNSRERTQNKATKQDFGKV